MTPTTHSCPEPPPFHVARAILADDPLSLWRRVERVEMPPETSDVLMDVLQSIHHLDPRWKIIQCGREQPAIDLAMAELHPLRPLRGHLLDLPMTAVLAHAVNGSLACAGVVVHGLLVSLDRSEAVRLAVSWDLAPIYGVVPGIRPGKLSEILGEPPSPEGLPAISRRDHLKLVVDNDAGAIRRDETSPDDGGEA